MQQLKEYLYTIPENQNKEEIYKMALNFLVQENFLNVLLNEISYKEFHLKLFELAQYPHGIGIGVALMAQVNIAGRILQILSESGNANIQPLLRELVDGKKIISMGVSEPDWKGRLSNLKSTLILNSNGKYILNGFKSFFTNGYHSDFYLVVVKQNQSYKIVLLDKNKPGLIINKFTLPFAQEATHCKIQFKNVEIKQSEILDFDYSKYAENLRLSEMLSLAMVFCGYANSTLEKIKSNEKLSSILREEEAKQKTLLRCKILIELLKARILEISELKDKNSNLELKEFFPYGTEIIADEFFSCLTEIFPLEELETFFKEKQLFQYKDLLNETYIRRAAKTVSGIVKSRDYTI